MKMRVLTRLLGCEGGKVSIPRGAIPLFQAQEDYIIMAQRHVPGTFLL